MQQNDLFGFLVIPIGAGLSANSRGAGLQKFASVVNNLCPDFSLIQEGTTCFINNNLSKTREEFIRDLKSLMNNRE